MASLVEKETGIAGERAKVAGVYANRMQKGMLLQCDPTIIYGLGPSFKGSLRRSHLQDAGNPYNTYQHAGLPPGPICSPGAAALSAALAPEEHDYFYFVATGRDGTHYFNKNLQGHNRDVARYLKELRSSRQAAKQTGTATSQTEEGKVASASTPLVNATDLATGGVNLEIVEEELALSQNATAPNSSKPVPDAAAGAKPDDTAGPALNPSEKSGEKPDKQEPAKRDAALLNATNATASESATGERGMGASGVQSAKLQTVNATKAANTTKTTNSTKEEIAKPASSAEPSSAPSSAPGSATSNSTN